MTSRHGTSHRVCWNNVLGVSFVVKCGARQGGVLSPYLFAIYIDDLIVQLKQSGHSIYIEQLFVGCVSYADDIALLSASCYGLQKLVDICSSYGIPWDMKLNPLKSQLITFGGGCNPDQCVGLITISGNSIPWVPKVKYMGVYIFCVTLLLLTYQKHIEISMESLTVSCLFLVNAPMRWLPFVYLKHTVYQL